MAKPEETKRSFGLLGRYASTRRLSSPTSINSGGAAVDFPLLQS
jgi:hypothetical protein